ncbi:hypothetical protein DNTS_028331, partial [Danionella cerebrum]
EKTPSPRLIRKVYSNNKLRASGLLLVLDFNHGGMLLLRQRRTSVLGVCEAILFREKPYPAEPSCVSLKSHQSMYRPIEFNDRPLADDLRVNFISSESSCGSLKSEPSLNRRMGFKERKREKTNPVEPSCVSLKSDRSMDRPIEFND